MLTRTALYTTNTVLFSPLYESKEKPLGNVEAIVLPIYISGQLVYEQLKSAKVINGQEIIFPLLWQSFFDSLIFSDFTPLFVDSLIVISTYIQGEFIDQQKFKIIK